MTSKTFENKPAPQWLLDMWREIDDKTFGAGFDCFRRGRHLQSRCRGLAWTRSDQSKPEGIHRYGLHRPARGEGVLGRR